MTAEKTSLQCHLCNKDFKYESERSRHEKSHIPQFQCKVCSKTFSFVSALRRHERQHDRTQNVKCENCGKTFRDQTLLKRHTKYAHGGVYTCTKCNNTFSSQPALHNHLKTHRVESDRQYHCSFQGCTKAFNFPHHLKHHELTHTNSKQHFCGVCGKGFIQSHHLKTHLKMHDPEVSLYCTFPGCDKRFSTEYARKRHLARHENKVDSGISSESNSSCETNLTSLNTKGTINRVIYKDSPAVYTENKLNLNCIKNDNEDIPEDLSMGKIKNDFTDTVKRTNKEVRSCETALGECIMSIKDDSCVCSQISHNVTEDCDFTPIENECSKNKLNIDDITFRNPCEGCACADHCTVQNIFSGTGIDVIPEVVYRADGTVKIKDAFDFNGNTEVKDKVKWVSDKFIPFNSCKAVLGRCIVSANGAIGEGCLCARMPFDDEVTAQEIEDITPHPKNEYSV